MGDDFDTALALGGLEGELRLIRVRMDAAIREQQRMDDRLGDIDDDLKKYEELADKLKEALGQHTPPFNVGQHARVKSSGGILIVEAVDRAFGQWLVMGHFRFTKKQYTYPASELVADDDYEEAPF
jgi:hypothetical protein